MEEKIDKLLTGQFLDLTKMNQMMSQLKNVSNLPLNYDKLKEKHELLQESEQMARVFILNKKKSETIMNNIV